jgi:excinuclease ABC subunit A
LATPRIDEKTPASASRAITARGVRVHNLKNVDVSIPTARLVVVTGVSGSGKSSLAFDTLYAEGQRRYVESLSAYARQFLERIERPHVESIVGLCPTIAIRQKAPSRNPRSTVATATEIHDYLRVLMARVGRTFCDSCGCEVLRDTPDSAAGRLGGLEPGSLLLIGFPYAVGGTPLADVQERLSKKGFGRVVVGDSVVRVDGMESLGDELTVLVDRVAGDPDARSRIADAIETCFAEGGGAARVKVPHGPELRFSEGFECARCGRDFERPEPRLYSFNNPYGACPACHGFGNLIEVDLDLVVPDKTKSLVEGAIEPWNKPQHRALLAELKRFARRHDVPTDVPWQGLSEDHRRLILEGDEEFSGVLGFFRWLEAKKYKVQVRVLLSRYRGYQICPSCNGTRLRPEALQTRLGDLNIDEICRMTVRDAGAFFAALDLDGNDRAVGERALEELRRRLSFLCDVGLDYLTLDRAFGTLSGGEAQRIALATSLGTGLVGTLYVLDEPSVGLHPRDTERLIGMLLSLRDQGNTVLVVEHDKDVLLAADHVIDLGPGAGEQGGRVVFSGTCEEMLEDVRSLTGKCLRQEIGVPVPERRRRGNGLSLVVRGAQAHNLKAIDVRIPLGAFTCVTGVSGSGKSTLVHDVLCGALLHRHDRRGNGSPSVTGTVEGAEFVEEVVLVDQSPIGRTPRSNPITYVKGFDEVREAFAATKDARDRGLTASHFSFNVPGGRCEVCSGDGQVKVDLQFLADVYLVCEACGGRRFRPDVLAVRYRDRAIDQVLEMSVREAIHFFSAQPRLVKRLRALDQIGLGYLRLGQPATTLSGGEAQRIKLAAHLLRKPGARVLYVLDEPTTGLHMADVKDLLTSLNRLLDAGATLVVIEHNMDVVKQADWVIDLGPEGGEEGGYLVFQGTPEALVAHAKGATAGPLERALDAARSRATLDR